MALSDHSWILVLALVMVGGISLFMWLDSIHPPATAFLPAPPSGGSASASPSSVVFGPSSAPGSSPSSTPLSPSASARLSWKNAHFQPAPAWSAYQGVINGPNGDSLSSADLRGKAVLVDFWTYSCINCIRTLPYIEAWQSRYGPQGLVVVEFHSPEFEFEKDRSNVEAAVRRFNLTTITVLDGTHRIWSAFGNQYWPHVYLIDADGFIRYDRIGEGGYLETEDAIRSLLAEQNSSSSMPSASSPVLSPLDTVDFSQVGTPELYIGSSTGRSAVANLPSVSMPGQPSSFSPPASLSFNRVYLNGTWVDDGEAMRLSSSEGDILLNYHAKSVHLVADSMDGSSVSTSLDGAPYLGPEADSSGSLSIGPSRLYSLVLTPGYETHTLRIHIKGAGLRAYSFTFG